ncbi:MAG: hypothetical protein M3451_03935, partial [Chloroflexota bacterium]|nr:hypothetical protein [Chloroflexota bacterium]
SVNTTLAMEAVPLVASGLVQSLGNAEIVAAPNAGGFGIPASMWSPNNICMSGGGGCSGIGSVTTCYVGDYLRGTPESELKTTCATSNACGCPAATALGSDFLSGHSGSLKREGIDILDRDGCVLDTNTGKCADGSSLPDISFYPGAGFDDPGDPADDSLFEWIFGVTYESDSTLSPINGTGNTLQNCAGPTNCAVYALTEDLGAETKTSCAGMNASTEGLIYVSGACSLSGTIGSPDKPVVLVVNDEVTVGGNLVFYGMLFVRSNNNSAELKGSGNPKIFGSIVVQGDVKLTGGVTLVYDDTSASGCSTPNCLSKTTKFARLPSSWLDSAAGF